MFLLGSSVHTRQAKGKLTHAIPISRSPSRKILIEHENESTQAEVWQDLYPTKADACEKGEGKGDSAHDRSRETAVVLQSKGSRIQRIVLQDVVDM